MTTTTARGRGRATIAPISAGTLFTTILRIVLVSIPLALSLVALLDAARRPEWAFAYVGRNRVTWVALCGIGILFCLAGVIASVYYLTRVRPQVAAVEKGRLT